MNAAARKAVYCPYCTATNGTVKKVGAIKIIHDKFRAKKTAEELDRFKASFATAVEAQKEIALYIKKAVHEDLNPLKVLDLFRRISDEVSRIHFSRLLVADIVSLRTANSSGSTQLPVAQKNTSGNTSQYHPCASDHL